MPKPSKILVGLQQAVQHSKTNTIFKIEKGILRPDWITRKYPLSEMNVGDSFLLEAPNDRELRRIRAAACVFGKRAERLYSVRKDPKKSGSYRCWRVE